MLVESFFFRRCAEKGSVGDPVQRFWLFSALFAFASDYDRLEPKPVLPDPRTAAPKLEVVGRVRDHPEAWGAGAAHCLAAGAVDRDRAPVKSLLPNQAGEVLSRTQCAPPAVGDDGDLGVHADRRLKAPSLWSGVNPISCSWRRDCGYRTTRSSRPVKVRLQPRSCPVAARDPGHLVGGQDEPPPATRRSVANPRSRASSSRSRELAQDRQFRHAADPGSSTPHIATVADLRRTASSPIM